MSTIIDRNQLESLMEELPLEEIYRRHAADFDDECVALWPELMTFDREINALAGHMARLAPPTPRIPARIPAPKPNRPWWNKYMTVPIWTIPLAAAATILLVLVPFEQERIPIETPDNFGPTRSLPEDNHRRVLDQKAYEAAMTRGLYLFENGDERTFPSAIRDFEYAMQLKPDDDRPLNYLEIMADSLKDPRLIKRYRKMRTSFNARSEVAQ